MKNSQLLDIFRNTSDADELYRLLEKENFKVDDLTEEGDSLFHLRLSVWQLRGSQYDAFFNDARMNPNVLNRDGKTPFECLISGYVNISQCAELINHPIFNINTRNQLGNNYFQVVALSDQTYFNEIAELLTIKKIDLHNVNNLGQSCLDVIVANKGNRSEYWQESFLKQFFKNHPAAVFEKNNRGQTYLRHFIGFESHIIGDDAIQILVACKTLADYPERFSAFLTDYFKEFAKNNLISDFLIKLIEELIKNNYLFNVEECIALNHLVDNNFEKNTIEHLLLKIMPTANFANVIQHVKALTPEGSPLRANALESVLKSNLFLTCTQQESFTLEDTVHEGKRTVEIDHILFGHLFSLEGKIPGDKGYITLTGSHFTDTAPFVNRMMSAYVAHCAATHKHPDQLAAIKQVQVMTRMAMRRHFNFGNYCSSSTRAMLVETMPTFLNNMQQAGIEILTGWREHGIDIVIKGDDFYRNNGGGCNEGFATEHYKITRVNNFDAKVVESLFYESDKVRNKSYIQKDLHDILGLNYVSAIEGRMQTVGNCSLNSQLIALKTKYRLYLPATIADDIYTDTIQFFEEYYLNEFVKRHANNYSFPHILMRLILENLLPNNKIDLAKNLIATHFSAPPNKEIMQAEFMIHQFIEPLNSKIKELGVDLNVDGNTRLEIYKRLIENTATNQDLQTLETLSLKTLQGYNALHFAVMNDNLALAEKILAKFDFIDSLNWFGETAFYFVKSVAMVELLVKAGAYLKSTKEDNALDHVIKADRPDLVEAMLKAGVLASDHSAYYAADKNPKILLLLIQYQPAALKEKLHDESMVIHAAASKGNLQNLRNLIYYGGLSPEVCNVNGVTPLHLALKGGHKEAARALICNPHTFYKKPHRGDDLQAMTKDEELKKLLIEKEQQKKDDLTAFDVFKTQDFPHIKEDLDFLIIALRMGSPSVIRGCLLKYPNLQVTQFSNHYACTPLGLAIKNLQFKKGQAYQAAFEIVTLLMNTPGININAQLATSEPIVFTSTSIGDVATLELFLADEKFDPNQQDNCGYTALHDAVERGHKQIVARLLQDERVDATLTKKEGLTAAQIKCPEAWECRELVAEHQAKQTLKHG